MKGNIHYLPSIKRAEESLPPVVPEISTLRCAKCGCAHESATCELFEMQGARVSSPEEAFPENNPPSAA